MAKKGKKKMTKSCPAGGSLVISRSLLSSGWPTFLFLPRTISGTASRGSPQAGPQLFLYLHRTVEARGSGNSAPARAKRFLTAKFLPVEEVRPAFVKFRCEAGRARNQGPWEERHPTPVPCLCP